MEKYNIKCVTKIMTIAGRKKRVLKYVNDKNKTEKLLLVGSKGGVSYKPPNSKSRRYVSRICKRQNVQNRFGMK